MKTPAPRPAREDITARKSGTPAKTAKPKPARYQIAWQNPVTGDIVQIRITHARDYLALGQDHIEIESLKPKRASLPITETGYRSHFIPALELINAGGPVTFVTAWIEREAASKTWRVVAIAKAQGDLFQWADASSVTTARKKPLRSKKAATHKTSSRHQVVPDADYVTDREMNDGQMRKRLVQRDRGKKLKPPREP